jgi:hypothetical protein
VGLDELTVSHVPPLVVLAVAVKLTPVVVLPTDRLCEAGGVPPVWNPKARVLGVTVIVGAVVTMIVTDTVTEPMEEDTAIEPMCVPADNPLGLTETVTLAGVMPVAGLAESQDPLVTLVENPTFGPVLGRTEKLCEEGVGPPC